MDSEADHGEIANVDLTETQLPPRNASWETIFEFAHSFNGYAYSDKCGELANGTAALFARSHRFLERLSLSDLRACLFFEARRCHHSGQDPGVTGMVYIHRLVEAIREKVRTGNINENGLRLSIRRKVIGVRTIWRRPMKRRELVGRLRCQTAEYFAGKGYPTAKCGYILAKHDDWRKNIILKDVADYIEHKKRQCQEENVPFPLHKYIHHGLSSQACLFNLLGPFLARHDYAVLGKIVRLSGLELVGDVKSADFEMEDRRVFNEAWGQPTSIDLYLETDRGEKVFTEFKFTESEFGTCSVYEDGDCDGANPREDLDLCYLHGLGRTYMTLMNKYGLLTATESCPFTEFYQAYRLLLFALEKGGVFLLVCDERNPAFLVEQNGVERGRYRRFKKLLPQEVADRVFALSIQQIAAFLEERGGADWLEEFKTKYM